jgi:predicted TIM-barrel fold metal-dependent hydrolase
MQIIDGHAHLPARQGAAETLLARMDALGIARAVVIPGGTVTPLQLAKNIALGCGSDVEIDHQFLLKACAASASRLIPFYFANPHRDASAYEAAGERFYGLKLGPAVHGVRLDDPRTRALIEVAERFGHPVYLHCLARPGFGVAELVELARGFPRVRFILGHAGVGHCDLYGLSLIAKDENIYFETSGGFSAVVREALAVLGAERVLFGSEYPLSDPRLELEKVRDLAGDERARALALGGTIAQLLGGVHA